jgi:hypothetical protein
LIFEWTRSFVYRIADFDNTWQYRRELLISADPRGQALLLVIEIGC